MLVVEPKNRISSKELYDLMKNTFDNNAHSGN